MIWISIKQRLPIKDGTYLTFIKTKKYESVGFTQFIDGQFMSSFVELWMPVPRPDIKNFAELIYNSIGNGYGFNGSKDEAICIINKILTDE